MSDRGATAPPFEEVLKIDVHAHFFDDMPEFVEMARRINMRFLNICVYGNRPDILEPCEARAESLYRKYRPTFHFGSTFDLTRRDKPDYVGQVIAWLDKTFDAGAVTAKIWKEVGMELKTADGGYVMPDDPLFDPIYEHIAACGKPLTAHFADPLEAWLPLDPSGVNYSYYANTPEWHVYGRESFPGHSEILAAADRILVKHPRLVMIAAHLASMEHDLDALAARLDHLPNLYVDVSARTPALWRQPAARVRDFLLTYQDRILYGVDVGEFDPDSNPSATERAAFTVRMEKHYRSDYLFYSGNGKHAFGRSEVQCLALPHDVLEKFYHGNAQRLMPALGDSGASNPRS